MNIATVFLGEVKNWNLQLNPELSSLHTMIAIAQFISAFFFSKLYNVHTLLGSIILAAIIINKEKTG